MNDLKEKLARLVEKAIDVAEKTGEFVIDQAPELLQQFYAWHITKNVFVALSMCLVIFLIWKGFRKLGKDEDPDKYGYVNILGKWYEDFSGIMMFICIVVCGSGVALWFLLSSLYNIIFIIVAPKIYLIEYFVK